VAPFTLSFWSAMESVPWGTLEASAGLRRSTFFGITAKRRGV
jgi:hypothetical protein